MENRLDRIQNWPELAGEAKWCAETLSKDCGVSLRTLQRFFLKKMGKCPKAWLSEEQEQQAARLLDTGSSVKETARLLDYKHPNHLTNAFTRHFGYCPTNKTIETRLQSPP